jgi:S1-C subfamily serine protease
MGLPADNGVLIMKVQPGGAADRAGLHAGNERAFVGNRPIVIGGDLIVAIDGEPVSDQQDLANVMDKHHAGDTVTVSIFRGKRKMDVKVVLQEEGRQQV